MMEINSAESLAGIELGAQVDIETEAQVDIDTGTQVEIDVASAIIEDEVGGLVEKKEILNKPITEGFYQDVGRIACAGCFFLKLCMPESDDNFVPFEDETVVTFEGESPVEKGEMGMLEVLVKEESVAAVKMVVHEAEKIDDAVAVSKEGSVIEAKKKPKMEIITPESQAGSEKTKNITTAMKKTTKYEPTVSIERIGGFIPPEEVLQSDEIVQPEKIMQPEEVVQKNPVVPIDEVLYEVKKLDPVVVIEKNSDIETSNKPEVEPIKIKPKTKLKGMKPKIATAKIKSKTDAIPTREAAPKHAVSIDRESVVGMAKQKHYTGTEIELKEVPAKKQLDSRLEKSSTAMIKKSKQIKRDASKKYPPIAVFSPELSEQKEEITMENTLATSETQNIILPKEDTAQPKDNTIHIKEDAVRPKEDIAQSKESSETPHQPTYLELLLDDEVEAVTTKGYYKNINPIAPGHVSTPPDVSNAMSGVPPTLSESLVASSDAPINGEEDIAQEHKHKDIKPLRFNDNFVNIADEMSWVQKILGTISIALYNNIYGSSSRSIKNR